jgi:hypothetical protein
MDDFIPRDDPRYAANLASFEPVSDEAGSPKTLYHATSSDFSSFDPNKAAKNSGHPASRLGHFMTETPEAADLFSREPDKFSQGTGEYKAGANIMPVHASIKNPHVMHWKEFAGALASLNTMPLKKANKEVDAFRKQLIEAGHDGILIKGGWKPGQFLGSPEFASNNWVAFSPNQIKSALGNSGGFNRAEEDINKAYGGALSDDDEGITAYHGSPHEFQQFDMSKVGTGEGAQAYGHGLYFAEAEPVANTYRGDPEERYRRFSGHMDPKEEYAFDLASHAGEKTDWDIMKGLASKYGEGISYEDAEKLAKNAISKRGHMYEVRIKAKPEHFIDWDAPLSEQDPYVWSKLVKDSPDFIKSAVRQGIKDEKTWGDIHNSIVVKHPRGHQGVTEHLAELGIPGIKYLDQGSRGTGEGTSNYVVFDDKLVNMKRKYEEGGEVEMPAKKTGRIKRNTGGRIPEMDKLFKRAKKYVDEQTKPMLGLHDDVIVKALHIAKKKV